MSATPTSNSPEFTEQQGQAVRTRNVSVSLSAGAGCGKTFVLTERYLSHLDPSDSDALGPEQIGRLVAITFTDRAAREMRDRIRRRCFERMQGASADDAEYWARLLRALDNARISTIHAFCASLLRTHAVEAGLDPQFAVLEQSQAETLLSEAVDDEVRRLIADQDEMTLQLATQFGLDALRAMVRQLVVEANPREMVAWKALSPQDVIERWVAYHEQLKPKLAAQLLDSDDAKCVLDILRGHMPDHPEMQRRRASLLGALEALNEFTPADSLVDLLALVEENARVKGGGGARVWDSPEVYGQFRDAATRLRKLAGELRTIAGFHPIAALPAAELGMQLLELAACVSAAYEERKRELRVLDFGDLMYRARMLLMTGDVAQQLSDKITLLLVDEFQDTDPTQVELVEALCGEGLTAGRLFFVGDHKQSIYRFRGANPHVFASLRERTPADGQQTLSLNFRSQPAILEFVNALFWDDLGSNYEPLRPRRDQVSPRPAVEFVWAHNASSERESVAELRHREAEWIARRLRTILDSKEPLVWDAAAAAAGRPAARAAQFGDIAILLRALTNVEAYEAALRKYEIDYYLVGGHAFYAQQEIFDLLNLLRTLNSTSDVVSLVGVLRSPFFSLSDEAIFWLAQHPGGVSEGLFSNTQPEAMSRLDKSRITFAARTIEHLRSCKDRLRISELIELALSLTGYDAVLLKEFLGERKLANLMKLQEQARSFQRGDFLGLEDFIGQLAEFVVRQPDEPLAATHSEDTNVVRLMSVHQSKGLEFPIVVVPDMNRLPHGGAERVHFDAALGPLARPLVADGEPRPVTGYDLWRFSEKVEEAAELNRLLYVATTRAADYLILSAGVNAVGEAGSPWLKLLEKRFDLATGRFVADLPAKECRPQVRVTAEEPPAAVRSAKRKQRVDIVELTSRVAKIPASMFPVRPAVDAIPPDRSARRQYSFSRLSGMLRHEPERVDYQQETTSSSDARGLGTLVHAVLATLDFSHASGVRSLTEQLAEQHLPETPKEVDLAVELIERFCRSERARQLANAVVNHAEMEFLLAWPSRRSDMGDVVLRGYLDRLYQDADGQWHVIDFKTNVVGDRGVAACAAPYEMQMLVYGLAAERILKVAPSSLTLHFLRSGDEFSFKWNDNARSRVVQLVDQAIASAITEEVAERSATGGQ